MLNFFSFLTIIVYLIEERKVQVLNLLGFSISQRKTCFSLDVYNSLSLRIMPSVMKRKQKNTQNAQRKEIEREKTAKKKAERSQLPEKGKKR